MASQQLDSSSLETPAWGRLYGIGVGPGDPELITVKGLRILQRSPLVAFPAGKNNQPGIAEQIISSWLGPEQQTLPLVFPYIQDDAALQQAWDIAAAQVLPHLRQGQDVCFVSEGDVSFYSTFSYLAHSVKKLSGGAEAQSAARPSYPLGNQSSADSNTVNSNTVNSNTADSNPGPEVITVPGICSPLTAAAAVGQPLTLRQQKLLVLPALYDSEALERALVLADVVVLMKIGGEYSRIWSILQTHGLLDGSYIVERASWPQQRIHRDLGDRSQLALDYFSIWIIPTTEPPVPFGNLTV